MGETVLCGDLSLKNLQIKAYMRKLRASNNDERCLCCPYGYHVQLDFVDFAKDVSQSHCELHKVRRYQRRLERAQNHVGRDLGVLEEKIKETFSSEERATLNGSGSDSNNANLNHEKKIEKVSDRKIDKNDIIYISSNMDDSSSRSSDESLNQSPSSTQNNLNNSNCRSIFSSSSLQPEENYKKILSNKSFVVSYEHLMSIREQMSASLKRVQELEMDAKSAQDLRQQHDKILRENHDLQYKLSQQIENNTAAKRKSQLYIQMNAEASQWQTVSDLPSELLPNLERIFQIKGVNTQDNQEVKKNMKSRFCQTDISGHLIVDTLSYLCYGNSEASTQALPKSQRRNFGVTVRPTHHHFTQQISFSSPKTFKPDESLMTLKNLITISEDEVEKKVGTLLYHTMGFLFENSYQSAINLLKHELLTSSALYKCWHSQECQTNFKVMSDIATQSTGNECSFHKGVQAQPIQWNKSVNTMKNSMQDINIETERINHNDSVTQTLCRKHKNMYTQANSQDRNMDFGSQYKYSKEMSSISSNTDKNLIDDLVSEQIEHSMEIIQQELAVEFESRLREKTVIHTLETNESECSDNMREVRDTSSCNENYTFHMNLSSTFTKHEDLVISEGCHHVIPVENIGVEQYAKVVNTNICGSVSERASNHLVRSQINYIDLDKEASKNSNANVNGSTLSTLRVDTDLRNVSTNVEESPSDISDSNGSSPAEGSYYTTDRRIDYRNINQIEEDNEEEEENVESVTETEQKLAISAEKEPMLTSNTFKQVVETPPGLQFSESIKHACYMVASWMNDSTTTCSKDLNESLSIIRSFWFELTKANDINIKVYIEKFKTINPTLQERILNMTDSNGNTCLHYAVSEGRWSMVRQILETDQVDVSRTNKAGYTVLMLAAISDILDEETLKLLISKSEVDKQSANEAQQTALMIAASQGKTPLVQWLLEAGSSVNITDSDGSSALMCACDNGHLEVVRLFLSRADTDTELEDKAGSNAMKIALDNSHKDIALLIFARNNLHKGSTRSKRRSGSSSHPTSPLSQRKFK